MRLEGVVWRASSLIARWRHAGGGGPASVAATQPRTTRRVALRRVSRRARRGDRAAHRRADQEDDARREARPAHAALATGRSTTPDAKRRPVGGVFSLTDPAMINHYQHDRGRAVAPAHPDPVRLRHDPRLPHDLPDPARRRPSFRPERGARPTTASAPSSRPRSASSRSTARWSTSRTSRAGAASPRPAGEDPYLELGDGRRARARRAGHRLQRARQGRHERQALRGLRPAGGAGATTTRPTCRSQRLWNFYLPPFKAAVDAGADTAMCSFNALNGVPGLREPRTPRPNSSSSSGASTASSRATTRRSPSCAPARPMNPDQRPVRPRRRRRRPARRPRRRSTPAPTRRWSRPTIRDFGKQLVASRQVSMQRIDDAVRRILRVKFRAGLFDAPVRQRRPGARRSSCCRRTARRSARPPAARWSCSRTTATRCRSTRPRRPR